MFANSEISKAVISTEFERKEYLAKWTTMQTHAGAGPSAVASVASA